MCQGREREEDEYKQHQKGTGGSQDMAYICHGWVLTLLQNKKYENLKKRKKKLAESLY
jgi:hypothetical protein